jgi:TetR/AcrR family transcriptional regulator, transcriptional repressor of bet genes
MKEENKADGKLSFISEARREQIIEAAIQTLDDIGFVMQALPRSPKERE